MECGDIRYKRIACQHKQQTVKGECTCDRAAAGVAPRAVGNVAPDAIILANVEPVVDDSCLDSLPDRKEKS